MIEPEVASRRRSAAAFDRLAAVLIGLIAILAATFAVQQAHEGLAGTRAQVEGARLASDASARIGAGGTSSASALLAQQQALVIGMSGIGRRIAGAGAGDATEVAVGTALAAASGRLTAAVTDSIATTGGQPVDGYTAGLLDATDDEINAIVKEQNRQVDLSIAAGEHQLVAILGLSLVTFAGVLAGVAAVLGRGRAGWLLLALAWIAALVAAAPAVTWFV